MALALELEAQEPLILAMNWHLANVEVFVIACHPTAYEGEIVALIIHYFVVLQI